MLPVGKWRPEYVVENANSLKIAEKISNNDVYEKFGNSFRKGENISLTHAR